VVIALGQGWVQVAFYSFCLWAWIALSGGVVLLALFAVNISIAQPEGFPTLLLGYTVRRTSLVLDLHAHRTHTLVFWLLWGPVFNLSEQIYPARYRCNSTAPDSQGLVPDHDQNVGDIVNCLLVPVVSVWSTAAARA